MFIKPKGPRKGYCEVFLRAPASALMNKLEAAVPSPNVGNVNLRNWVASIRGRGEGNRDLKSSHVLHRSGELLILLRLYFGCRLRMHDNGTIEEGPIQVRDDGGLRGSDPEKIQGLLREIPLKAIATEQFESVSRLSNEIRYGSPLDERSDDAAALSSEF
jgi:hypothetical protein